MVMLLANKIKVHCEEIQTLQLQLLTALEIDTPMYSKIERGERPAKRCQVVKLAKLFEIAPNGLLTL